jgi:hypothetical protein
MNYLNDIEQETDAIDKFMYSYSDDVINLYKYIKQRFTISSPFFLSYLYSYHLTCYIIDKCILHENFTYSYNKNTFNYFCTYYNNELQISYTDIQKFVKSTIKSDISYDDWCIFCFLYTDLYELRS